MSEQTKEASQPEVKFDYAASTKKVLIVYFSRTGHSEKIAKDLAAMVDADVLKVEETYDRTGIGNYFTSFNESYFKSDNSNLLKTDVFNGTEHYTSYVFVGPIWWWGLNSPIKNSCNVILKFIKPTQHVFLALSFRGKYNPGDQGSYNEFAALFKDKAVVHENYLKCQEDDYASGSIKENVEKFAESIKEVSK